MYPNALPQKATLPAITYEIISTRREHTISAVTRLAHARFFIRCFALTRDTADDIAVAIRKTGIDQFQGTVDGIAFQGIEFDAGDEQTDEPPTDGNGAHRYITEFDLLVHYLEAT